MPQTVQHLPDRHRFEVHAEGAVAELEYRTDGAVMTILHTEVPEPIGGRGIAGSLVAAALDEARARGWKVDPACPYAATWMERHPESSSLRA